MNIKEKLTCKYCHEILEKPINLNCCAKKICKQHIDNLLNGNSSNKFSCPLCKQENANQNLNCDELVESLIEMDLHKFKLDPKYEIGFNNLKSEIEILENILKHPENIIDKEISELKKQVNLDRDNNANMNDLIQQLESYEKKFKAEYKTKIDFEKYNQLLESVRKQLKEVEKCLNLFSVENNVRDEKNNKYFTSTNKKNKI
jgi:hypothetical protein